MFSKQFITEIILIIFLFQTIAIEHTTHFAWRLFDWHWVKNIIQVLSRFGSENHKQIKNQQNTLFIGRGLWVSVISTLHVSVQELPRVEKGVIKVKKTSNIRKP